MIKFIADQNARMIASVEQMGMVYLLGNKIISKLFDKNDIFKDTTLANYPTAEIARKVMNLYLERLQSEQNYNVFIFPKYDAWDEKEQRFIMTA